MCLKERDWTGEWFKSMFREGWLMDLGTRQLFNVGRAVMWKMGRIYKLARTELPTVTGWMPEML